VREEEEAFSERIILSIKNSELETFERLGEPFERATEVCL